MLYVFYSISATLFVIAMYVGWTSSSGMDNDISLIDEYIHKLKRNAKRSYLTIIIASLFAIFPIIDVSNLHEIKEYDSKSYSYRTSEYETMLLKAKYKSQDDALVSTLPMGIGLLFLMFTYVLVRFVLISGEKQRKIWNLKYAEREEEEFERKILMEKAQETQAIQKITEKYGKPDKIIHTTSNYPPDWTVAIFFVLDSKLLCYKDNVINFNEIIGCGLNDDSVTEIQQTGMSTTNVSTNTGSMVGRALVGGVVGGVGGAIIGGATASKTGQTEVKTNSISRKKHNYTILINTKNIGNPLVKIPCGNLGNVVDEVMATINAIIANNSQS